MLFLRVAPPDMDSLCVALALDIEADLPLRLLGVLDKVVKGALHLEEAVTLGKVAGRGQVLGAIAQGALHRKRAAKKSVKLRLLRPKIT